jgi:predicted DNA-binding transcriptional regulator YafY
MERFEVSERTVLNDIQFFKDRLHAPLEYSRSRRGYFYTNTNWKLSDAQTAPEVLLSLREAIQNRHPVDMVYFTAGRGEENQRIVHPYHLLNIRGEWYEGVS